MTCKAPGCETVLSRYNRDEFCSLHQNPTFIEHGYCLCGCGMRTKAATRTAHKHGAIAGEPQCYVMGHHKAVLTPGAVRRMRIEYAAGGESYRTLAQRYGVSEYTVRDAIKRHTWRDI